MTYEEFIASKRVADAPTGLTRDVDINPQLFDFQQAIVRWALRRGRAAIWADCGLGKTPMQLEWARHIPGRVLIAAPLAVGPQTEREGGKFGIECKYLRRDDPKQKIVITNYEILERFNPRDFTGIVLDESSILKSYTGKIRTQIITDWGRVQHRLACTATPAPNDYMELGNHSEFIGAMSRTEMLSMFFVHDGSETQQWRLKGHAQSEFWKWLCSWAVMIRKPSDVGYDDGRFVLPPLNLVDSVVEDTEVTNEYLFALQASTLQERLDARRRTVRARCERAAQIINGSTEPWLAWCNLNPESETIAALVDGAVEVTGSMSYDEKEEMLLGFTTGSIKRLVTKPTIAGHGLNWQHCSKMVFVGLSDSYEQYYQALRRCWRFGQRQPVSAHIITAHTEGAVTANIRRKEDESERMAREMVQHMSVIESEELRHTTRLVTSYKPQVQITLPSFL